MVLSLIMMEQKCLQVMRNNAMEQYSYINEYNLIYTFDISTSVYAGDSERCVLDWNFNRKFIRDI